MLAEVVIVSAILITTLVSLYAGFARVYAAHKERSSYFDIDSIYALKEIENFLIDNGVFNEVIEEVNNNEYVYYSENNIFNENSYIKAYIETIMKNYNIEYFYVTRYSRNLTDIESGDAGFDDFLIYLEKNLDYSENYDYSYKYIFVSKTKDSRFAYLRVI